MNPRNERLHSRFALMLTFVCAFLLLSMLVRVKSVGSVTTRAESASALTVEAEVQGAPKYSYYFAIGECPLFAFCNFNQEQADEAKAKCEARFRKGWCVTLGSSGLQPRQNCEVIYPDAGMSCEESKKPDDRPYSYYVGENIFCLWVPFHEGDQEGETKAQNRCKKCNKGEDCKVNRVPQSTPACSYHCDDDGDDSDKSSESESTTKEGNTGSGSSDAEEDARAKERARAYEDQKKTSNSNANRSTSSGTIEQRPGESDEDFRARQRAAEYEKQKKKP